MDDVSQAPYYHTAEPILRHARADHAGTRAGAREVAQQQRVTSGMRVFFGSARSVISYEVIDDNVFERFLTFRTS